MTTNFGKLLPRNGGSQVRYSSSRNVVVSDYITQLEGCGPRRCRLVVTRFIVNVSLHAVTGEEEYSSNAVEGRLRATVNFVRKIMDVLIWGGGEQ